MMKDVLDEAGHGPASFYSYGAQLSRFSMFDKITSRGKPSIAACHKHDYLYLAMIPSDVAFVIRALK
jgi:hypothetical protein